MGVASAEGTRTERFSEKSLNLENSLKSEVRLPSTVKRHFSYEGVSVLGSREVGFYDTWDKH